LRALNARICLMSASCAAKVWVAFWSALVVGLSLTKARIGPCSQGGE
jgi:hypothetical protein